MAEMKRYYWKLEIYAIGTVQRPLCALLRDSKPKDDGGNFGLIFEFLPLSHESIESPDFERSYGQFVKIAISNE